MTSSARSCRLAGPMPARRCRRKPISVTLFGLRALTKKALKPTRRHWKSNRKTGRLRSLLSPELQRQIALLVGASILVHGALFAFFNREPEPHASIGVISVTAEIVLGAQTNAGKSPTPSESEIASAPSPTTDDPVDDKPEMARKDIAEKPVEEPKEEAKQEKAETASPKAEEAPSVEKPPVPKEQAELVVQTKPAEKPKLTVE